MGNLGCCVLACVPCLSRWPVLRLLFLGIPTRTVIVVLGQHLDVFIDPLRGWVEAFEVNYQQPPV